MRQLTPLQKAILSAVNKYGRFKDGGYRLSPTCRIPYIDEFIRYHSEDKTLLGTSMPRLQDNIRALQKRGLLVLTPFTRGRSARYKFCNNRLNWTIENAVRYSQIPAIGGSPCAQ
jgi:hypothetical protein